MADDPFFVDFKLLFSRKWTVIFKNRNFWLQIRIPWVNRGLGDKFYKSRSETAIVREAMPIFLLTLDKVSKCLILENI